MHHRVRMSVHVQERSEILRGAIKEAPPEGYLCGPPGSHVSFPCIITSILIQQSVYLLRAIEGDLCRPGIFLSLEMYLLVRSVYVIQTKCPSKMRLALQTTLTRNLSDTPCMIAPTWE